VPSLDSVSMLGNQNIMATATQAKAIQQSNMGASKKSLGNIDSANRMLTSNQKTAQRGES
jgi:hypothetical protein